MVKKSDASAWPTAMGGQIPGFGNPLGDNPLTQSLQGGFDFMKSLWGGLPSSMPGLVVPTIDVEELDRRIKDLKAVESWLEVNANMLRGTIQALEVQRNTVATLQSLGGTFGGGANEILKNMNQLAQSAPVASPSWPNAPARPAPKAAPEPAPAEPPTRARASAKSARAAKPEVKHEKPAASTSGAASAWLDFLQNQFNQVALAALTPAGKSTPPAKTAGKSAATKGTRSRVRARRPAR